ncbi:MAG: tetratricopeptide repeat protein, partial [Myxococcales bacterium]|nr:tetratricopeptide repeat protein [Myxococcales bacterium]
LKAVDIADQLPSIATCESAEYVNAVFAPPSTPEAAAEIEGLRQQLTRAATLETAGELPRARALASEVALRASELSYRPLEAQARLLDGRAQMELGEARPADTAALLNQALAAATAADLPDIAAESLARGLFVQALDGHADDALRWATVAEAHLERAVERDRLRGLLRNNLGAIYRMRGDDERARELLEEALTARVAAHGAQHVEVARTLINLSLVSESDGARVDAMRRALEIFEAQLGPSHPETLDKRIGLSVHLSSPSEAAELLERACAQFSHEHPDSTEIRQRCLIFLAHHRAETGDTARAAGTLRTALQLTAARADAAPIDALGRATVEALASYYEGDYAAGVAAIEGPLRDAGEADAPWWIERRLGEAAYALGLNLLALDRRDEAVGPLERAVAAMSRAREAAPRVEYYQREANAQWALAQALGRSPETRARADELAAAAARWYERAGPEYASRLAAVRSRRE